MAMTRKLVIEVATNSGGTKAFTFKNPKLGITRAQAVAFAEKLYEDDILDPTIGTPGDLVKAYYEETTTTDLT